MIKNISIAIVIGATLVLQSTIAIATTSTRVSSEQINASKGQLESPIEMLNGSILKIQTILTDNSKSLIDNPKKLMGIIDQYFIPYIDSNRVAGMMLGVKWRNASVKQKQDFIKVFTVMLANLYSKSVAKVGNYKMIFRPLEKSSWEKQKFVTVAGKIINIEKGGQGSRVSIYLIRSANTWKIYDVAVEGVSIIQNYRSQFQPLTTMNDAINAVEKVNARTRS